MTTLYKVLAANRMPYHGGSGQWLPAKRWMKKIPNPVLCQRGYHLVTLKQLVQWLGPEIWIAEGRGASVSDGTKSVWESARLIKRTAWGVTSARLFAADCAEHVLHLYEAKYPNDDRPRKAIEAARSGKNAAAYAAYVAANAAANAAAYAAAYDADANAAHPAAYAAYAAAYAAYAAYVAAYAAYAAANAASDAAERKWQSGRLKHYLAAKGEK